MTARYATRVLNRLPSLPWRRDRAASVRAYERWRSGHCTRSPATPTRHPKVRHRWYLAARWHARHLTLDRADLLASPAQAWQAYPCRWADDYREGETAKLHYHVGRPPRTVVRPAEDAA